MIILPDRCAPRGKILPPMPPAEWRGASQGRGEQRRWRLTGRLDDGAVVWRGWFDDRVDADEFLHALARGSLVRERGLWRLPNEGGWWHPDFGLDLVYSFSTVIFETASPGSNLTFNVPSDWNNGNNMGETVGGGAASANGAAGAGGVGGGGGAYSAQTNINLTPSGTATYQIGLPSGDTWFNGTTLATSSVGSKGASGATGGAAASGVGSTTNSGGNGGSGGADGALGGGGGGGGGGAAGSSGSGGAGGNGIAGVGTSTGRGGTGGTADALVGGIGGAGGAPSGTHGTNGAFGGNGTEWSSLFGSGGGGGAGGGASSGAAGAGRTGGNYGGGAGGGGGSFSGTQGSGDTGIQGIVVLTYTPQGVPVLALPSRRFIRR